MLTAGAALLLIVQFVWTTLAHARADIDLSNPGAIGVFATNTDWSIAKNGGFANGTASWTVNVTKVPVSDQLVEVFGQLRINNTGTGRRYSVTSSSTCNASAPRLTYSFQRQWTSRAPPSARRRPMASSYRRPSTKVSSTTSPVRSARGPRPARRHPW